MSYDLILQGPDVDAFRTLMKHAPHVQENGNDGWLYHNEATGVYFALNVAEVVDEEDIEAGLPAGPYIDCEGNDLRPTFFVDESVPAILSYADSLGWTVRDPQIHDIARPPADVDVAAIREHWQSVTRAWLRLDSGELPRMDPDASTALWRYNRTRAQLDAGEHFVPTLFVRRDAADRTRALRLLACGAGVGMLLPRADIVAVEKRRMVGPIPFGNSTTEIVPYGAFIAALDGFAKWRDDGMPALSIDAAERATKTLRKLRGEPLDAYEALGFDGFVDVD